MNEVCVHMREGGWGHAFLVELAKIINFLKVHLYTCIHICVQHISGYMYFCIFNKNIHILPKSFHLSNVQSYIYICIWIVCVIQINKLKKCM